MSCLSVLSTSSPMFRNDLALGPEIRKDRVSPGLTSWTTTDNFPIP